MEKDKVIIASLLDIDFSTSGESRSWYQKPWKCLHCKVPTTIIENSVNYHRKTSEFYWNNTNHKIAIEIIICPNQECKKESILLVLFNRSDGNYHPKKHWQVEPQGNFKDFSMYNVPSQILQDYQEACLVKSISPNASATMSRRCLQSMIRDYWGIKERTLFEEIKKLKTTDHEEKGKVKPKLLQAIDKIRDIGNIGSHFDKEENEFLSNVKENEADKMIWLIEYLIENWYVQDYEDNKHLEEINQTRDNDNSTEEDSEE